MMYMQMQMPDMILILIKDVNPKLESPVCRLAGSTEWLGGTDAIIDELIAHNAKVKHFSERKPIMGKVCAVRRITAIK